MAGYFLMCQPEPGLGSMQLGQGGENASIFSRRLLSEVVPFQPDVVTACYGMNDGGTVVLSSGFTVLAGTSQGVIASENFNDGTASGWTVVNESGETSRWRVVSGAYTQQYPVAAFDGSFFVGSYSYWTVGLDWSDYEAETMVRALDSNEDSIGLMFRFQDPDNYYRLAMSRRQGWRRLEKKLNGTFSTLAIDGRPPELGQTTTIRVEVDGAMLFVYVDGEAVFGVQDYSLPIGSIALHCQGDSVFDNVVVRQPFSDPKVALSHPLSYTVPVTSWDSYPYDLRVSAIAGNVPGGGGVRFALADFGGTVASSTDYSAPYARTFTGLGPGDYRVTAQIVDSSGTSIIREYNQVIDNLTTSNGLPVTPPDLYTYFELYPEEFSDNLHPNGLGYDSLSFLVCEALVDSGMLP